MNHYGENRENVKKRGSQTRGSDMPKLIHMSHIKVFPLSELSFSLIIKVFPTPVGRPYCYSSE